MTTPPPVLGYEEPPADPAGRNRMAYRSLGYAAAAVLLAAAVVLVLLVVPVQAEWQATVVVSAAVAIVVLLLAGIVVGMIGTDSDPRRLPALLAALLNAALLVGGCLYIGRGL